MENKILEVKRLKSELDKIQEQIKDNAWDDAFTGPPMSHNDYMSRLYKTKNELQKLCDKAISEL